MKRFTSLVAFLICATGHTQESTVTVLAVELPPRSMWTVWSINAPRYCGSAAKERSKVRQEWGKGRGIPHRLANPS